VHASDLELKELRTNTPLLRTDRVEAIVVVADEHDYAYAAGGTLVEYLMRALDREIPLVWEEDFDNSKRYKRRNVIALGSFGSHRFLSRLYSRGAHYCDDRFPGDDGYVIRTMHDIDQHGRNVIMLSGGDETGWRDGTQALCDMLTGLEDRVLIPPTNCVVSRLAPPPPKAEHVTGRLRDLVRIGRSDEPQRAMDVLLDWAGCFDLAGDLLQGMLFRAGFNLLEELDHRGELKRSTWAAEPQTWLGRMVQLWDNVEERCVFDEEFRTRFTRFLLWAGERLDEKWHSGNSQSPLRGADRAGAIFGFRSLGRYFQHGYQLPQAKEWISRAKAALEEDLAEELLQESSAYGQCRMLHDFLATASELEPGTAEAIALARVGRRWISTFWSPGAGAISFGDGMGSVEEARRIAGRSLWLEGPERPASGECLQALEGPYVRGAHYAPEGFYNAMGESAIGARLLGGPGRPLLAEHGIKPADYKGRDPRLLHAGLSLRALVRTHGEYILMGGSRFKKGSHEDSQALLRVEYFARPFLADLPQAGPDGNCHAGVGLSLKGKPYDPPRLARAEALLHGGRLRIMGSETMDPDHPRWLRMVCHLPGRGFLLLDRITPLESGPMSARFVFPLIGEARLEEDDQAVSVSQSDARLWLQPLGQAPLTLETTPADLSSLPGLVEDAGHEIHWVSWEKEWKAKAGEPVTFATELRLQARTRRRPVVLRGDDEGPWACAMPNRREIIIGLDWDTIADAGVEVDAKAYALGAHLSLAGLRRIAFGDSYIETSSPCGVLIDPKEGQVRIASALRTDVYVKNEEDMETFTLDPGAELGLPMSFPKSSFAALLAQAAQATGKEIEEDPY
jgi:hypothetical protein